MPEPHHDKNLQELTLEGLPEDLVLTDDNLVERFARGAQSVRTLSIGDMRRTRPETRRSLALLTSIIVQGSATPTQIRLWNLGFEADDGQFILERLLDKGFGGFEELSLHMNDEFWTS